MSKVTLATAYAVALVSIIFHEQSLCGGPQLRLENRTNLTVSSLSSTGALFVFQATNVDALADSRALLFQTNNPTTNDVSIPVNFSSSAANRGFFSAAHWPGVSTADFGDPENHPVEVSPDKVLLTAGVREALETGKEFTVDFLVTDSAGNLLDIKPSRLDPASPALRRNCPSGRTSHSRDRTNGGGTPPADCYHFRFDVS